MQAAIWRQRQYSPLLDYVAPKLPAAYLPVFCQRTGALRSWRLGFGVGGLVVDRRRISWCGAVVLDTGIECRRNMR